jgi:hypothetical protein
VAVSSTTEKPPYYWVPGAIWLGIIATILGFAIWNQYFVSPEPSNCVYTTKQKQVITKLDGVTDSYETETVYGCELPDGTFIPAPDVQ